MNLNTTYLGLPLRSPLLVSASPLSKTLDNLKQMEEAGAGAIVLFSLFEEQLRGEQQRQSYAERHPQATAEDADALYAAQHSYYSRRLDDYLTHIQQAKASVSIPIIASLNCTALGSWTDYAQRIEQAGADALELNIYYIPTNMDTSAEQVEDMYVRLLKAVKSALKIPVAIKLTPFVTNLAHVARRLDQAGANALVLFNRFYQPDLDPVTLKMRAEIPLGTPNDSRLPLHWIAILYGYLRADLAASGGIYSAEDVVKMLMVGAKVTLLASALLQHGIGQLQVIERDLRQWMQANDYDSLASLQGIVSQFRSKDPSAFERSEYIRALTSFRSLL
ncbi:MAG: dihydroorotate dehydrogenase-like protein [Chloroflexi bacterium]|nr:dihydroorotate dehydrogenase-like protein [Chloroflexota bacterium]